MPDAAWYDEAAGPLVRPYAMTQGRTQAARPELDLITLLVSLPNATDGAPMEPEHRTIMSMCAQPTSVAEVSARLDLPLGVVKILISDLIERGLMISRSALVPDAAVLRAVLEGIRKL